MQNHVEQLSDGRALLELEGCYLDEHRWDDWIALFHPQCEYWVPTWTDDESLARDPRSEISHIFYANRAGLEDRVVRIRSGQSPASSPIPRTVHTISHVLPMEPPGAAEMKLRSSWATHVYFPTSKKCHAYFGRSEFLLQHSGEKWLIRGKKVVLANDYLPGMLDVYCI